MDLEKKEPNGGETPPEVPHTPPPPPGQPFGPGPGRPPGVMPLSEGDSKMWATLSHLGFVFGGFLTPLIIWQVFKDRSAFVDQHAKEALNFQLTVMIGFIVSAILIFIVIGIFLMIILGIGSMILGIMALIAANNGDPYTYPWSIKFVK